ncbi:MAG: hypothetical protein WBF67_07240, partial [Olleya sp.]
ITSLKYLERLELFGNKLSGTIPKDLGSLTNLKELILSYNRFEGDLPASTASLAQLKIVQLQGNNFGSMKALLNFTSQNLATFDSDDSFLNFKFQTRVDSKTRMATNKFEDYEK